MTTSDPVWRVKKTLKEQGTISILSFVYCDNIETYVSQGWKDDKAKKEGGENKKCVLDRDWTGYLKRTAMDFGQHGQELNKGIFSLDFGASACRLSDESVHVCHLWSKDCPLVMFGHQLENLVTSYKPHISNVREVGKHQTSSRWCCREAYI